MSDTEQEKSSEQQQREEEQQERDTQLAETLSPNTLNQHEAAHQRWLETGQTEPPFMYPSEEDQAGEGVEADEQSLENTSQPQLGHSQAQEDALQRTREE
jgi:hypothetical protein